ncbi:MAG: tetratricopeptide repeat protein [Dokdonella sp.]
MRHFSVFALLAALVVAPTPVFAEPVVKPVPTPDLSKLPPERATDLRETRETFESTKGKLVGDTLAEAYAIIGAAYASNGFLEAAGIAFDDATQLAPKDGRWVYAQGILARSRKQNAVAQNYFELALQLNREYAPIVVTVARAKIDNGDLDGARKLLAEFTRSHSDQAVPFAMLGEIALRQKRYPDAVEQTEKALSIDPAATRLYATLADAQTGAGNTKAAADARAKAGNVAPTLIDPLGDGVLGIAPAAANAPSAPTPPSSHASDAASFLALRQYDSARHELDEALKASPNDSTLLALYARVEAAAGNLPAAKTRAMSAIAAGKDNALAHLSLGVALEMANDDAGAQRAYEDAVRLDPKLGEARELYGALLLRVGRRDDAITQLRALVQLDLTNPEPWINLTAADAIAGRCGSALRDVSDVLAKDAGNIFVLQLFVRLASTCPAATPKERLGALEYGRKLNAAGTAQTGEAYALALAANGKWDDAVKTQQAAMFLLVRNGLKGALVPYREVLQQLQAHKLPDLPWPASAAMYHPARLAPDSKAAAVPAK